MEVMVVLGENRGSVKDLEWTWRACRGCFEQQQNFQAVDIRSLVMKTDAGRVTDAAAAADGEDKGRQILANKLIRNLGEVVAHVGRSKFDAVLAASLGEGQ
jgi:hypothetical protein